MRHRKKGPQRSWDTRILMPNTSQYLPCDFPCPYITALPHPFRCNPKVLRSVTLGPLLLSFCVCPRMLFTVALDEARSVATCA